MDLRSNPGLISLWCSSASRTARLTILKSPSSITTNAAANAEIRTPHPKGFSGDSLELVPSGVGHSRILRDSRGLGARRGQVERPGEGVDQGVDQKIDEFRI